jgi:hypothetical protein
VNFSHFELLTTSVSKDKGFLPVKREKIKHQNGGHLYRPCTSLALSVWDSMADNLMPTLDTESGLSIVPNP